MSDPQLRRTPVEPPYRVIVGRFAGLQTVRTLAGAPIDVMLLHQGATGAPTAAEIATRQRNARVVLGEVRDFDTTFEAAERETVPARRDALVTFVVVGAGPTGLELAGEVAEAARQAFVVLGAHRHHVTPAVAPPRDQELLLQRLRAVAPIDHYRQRTCRPLPFVVLRKPSASTPLRDRPPARLRPSWAQA
jgi:hypothetical protein